MSADRSWLRRFLSGTALAAPVVIGLVALGVAAGAEGGQASPGRSDAPDVVVHASDLPKNALSEFEFWDDPSSPGGRMVGTPNAGGELDPPPEDDPHVTFQATVQRGVPYRCWVRMKVGAPKGLSQANVLYLQFTDAVDRAQKDALRPGTGDYLTARGPARPGWTWVSCDPQKGAAAAGRVQFRTGGAITVRIQGGAEGVGFDQLVLSPSRFLDHPPAEAVVAKAKH